MGRLLDIVNAADRLVGLWRQGLAPTVIVADMLGDLGFTAIDIGERSIVAYWHGIRMEFDGNSQVIGVA